MLSLGTAALLFWAASPRQSSENHFYFIANLIQIDIRPCGVDEAVSASLCIVAVPILSPKSCYPAIR